MTMSIYTVEDIWELASEPDIDLEYEHVRAMSDNEIRASLQSRGHDLRVLEAEAMIMLGLPRKRTTYRAGFIGAGAAATLTAMAASVMLAVSSQPALQLGAGNAPPSTGATGAAGNAPPASAESLREEGLQACGASQWHVCLELLDRAHALDPRGDDAAPVRAARERAVRALASGGQ
jgi:hypothetical protein